MLTIVMYPLAVLGLYLAWAKGIPDVQWMFRTFPCPEYCHALLWGLLIAYVTVARFVGLFMFEGWRWTRRTTPMIGIAFWSSLLASNLHSPDTLAFGTLYGVAALLETWILSRAWLETA
jgi:hypothetical protein